MKRFLIVGSSSGIGKSIKQQLLNEGNEVIALGRMPVEGVSFYFCDILSADPLPVIEGPVHGLVYCPGSINLKPFRTLKQEDFLSDFHLHVTGAVKIIQTYLKNLQQAEQASIVFFSTVAVQTGMPFHASISAAKGAVEGLTRSLAAELLPNIRVNAIAPSLTETPLAEKLINSTEKKEAAAARHPLKRIGDPDEIASLACFLLSDKAGWITGQIIKADGGLSTIR
jgi:3-oxoacyl-[acyl-carrier protein] reductase